MVLKHAYLNTLLLLQSPFMLSVVKMPLKGEVGCHALNSHGNYIVDHGNSWKYHGNLFLNFCGNPEPVVAIHDNCCLLSQLCILVDYIANNMNPGLEVIKLFSYSTQLSTKFILLINVKMPTIVCIITFISMINTTYERL